MTKKEAEEEGKGKKEREEKINMYTWQPDYIWSYGKRTLAKRCSGKMVCPSEEHP